MTKDWIDKAFLAHIALLHPTQSPANESKTAEPERGMKTQSIRVEHFIFQLSFKASLGETRPHQADIPGWEFKW